ncbi:hypothetical protein [Flavobacterium collinsii]|uniref:Uncharacterized protein n=1 Tax=Flavobacterium collinsii TaxID=1114861 RepID=A0A9W4TJF1_9FLAO|nr:hypothetical protein [Flavobacterium collinsii]CAI2768094.1 conserved membrane protein of unknown function [Flavobacterium collinsii]
MKNKIKFELLTSELFVLGILLVLLNDFYLKYAFSNVITGKLSDFAGLFIFPFFISIFLPKHALKIYVSTAFFFVFWKLEISSSSINFISQISNFAFYRTVDVSDLIALSVLPFSYKYFIKESALHKKSYFVINSVIGILCFFTILADSQPRQQVGKKIKSNRVYTLSIRKEKLYNELNLHNIDPVLTESDNSICFDFDIPEYNASAIAKTRIKEDSQGNLIIRVDSISDITVIGRLFLGVKNSDIENCKKLKKEELENFFKENCLDKLLTTGDTKYSNYRVVDRIY